MTEAVYWKKEANIANIIFDDQEQKVNILSTPVMQRFSSVLDEISNDTSIQGIVISSNKKGIFIAGADIKEIQDLTKEEAVAKAKAGQEVFNKLSKLKPPAIAVLNGVALGGGLELALACRYRVAGFSEKIQLGLPEVRLGVIPGFGGTVRLPKIVGLRQALTMIPAGRIVSAKEALKIGLVDKLFPDNILLEEAFKFLKNPDPRSARVPRRKKPTKGILPKWLICRIARKKTLEKTKGFYPAPLRAIEVIAKGSLEYEAQVFGQLVITETAKNLIHVFFLSEKYKHIDWGVGDVKPIHISKCGVVGAGVMGGGIAHLLTSHNIPVRMKDINLSAIGKGLETARKTYNYPLKIRKIKPHEVDLKIGLISGTTSYTGFGNTDIVIEAVVEDMKIKENVFTELSKVVSPKTILATNTSSLSVTRMAKVSTNPERVIGMHFFNPVDRMPLVEVIITKYTSKETIASVINLARQLGKTVIVVKDKAGFLVNRILLPYINEGSKLLMEGNPKEHIDNTMRKFGMPMGPLELADMIGINICYKVGKILEEAFGPRMAVTPISKEIKASKKDPEEAIQKRLMDRMVNEAELILKEGIVDDPDTIDIGMIFGTGFPPFRGGLLGGIHGNP